MFEKLLSKTLSKYLGQFVEGLDQESLKLGVWKGDVSLQNLALKTAFLESFGLPFTCQKGCLGSLKLHVSWQNTKKKPALVELDDVLIVLECRPGSKLDAASILKSMREAQLSEVESAVQAALQGDTKDVIMPKLVKRILHNMQVCLTNLHIKILLQGGLSMSLTLSKLKVDTADRNYNVITSKTAEEVLSDSKMFKLLSVENFCIQVQNINASSCTTQALKDEIFSGQSSPTDPKMCLRPINLYAKACIDKNEKPPKGMPRATISADVPSIDICVTPKFSQAAMKLADYTILHEIRMMHLSIRPDSSPKDAPLEWFRYAVRAIIDSRRRKLGAISWGHIEQLSLLRAEFRQLAKRSVSAESRAQLNQDALQLLDDRMNHILGSLPRIWAIKLETARQKEASSAKDLSSKAADQKKESFSSKFAGFSRRFKGRSKFGSDDAEGISEAETNQLLEALDMDESAVISPEAEQLTTDDVLFSLELNIGVISTSLCRNPGASLLSSTAGEIARVVASNVFSVTVMRAGRSASGFVPLMQDLKIDELQVHYRDPNSKAPVLLMKNPKSEGLPMLCAFIETANPDVSTDLTVVVNLEGCHFVLDPRAIVMIGSAIQEQTSDVLSETSARLANATSESVRTAINQSEQAANNLLAQEVTWNCMLSSSDCSVSVHEDCHSDDSPFLLLTADRLMLSSFPTEEGRMALQTKWISLSISDTAAYAFKGVLNPWSSEVRNSRNQILDKTDLDVAVVGKFGSCFGLADPGDVQCICVETKVSECQLHLSPESVAMCSSVATGFETAKLTADIEALGQLPWSSPTLQGHMWVSVPGIRASTKPVARWVTLTSNSLFIFKNDSASKPMITSELSRQVLTKGNASTGSNSFSLKDSLSGKEIVFIARSHSEAEDWEYQISASIHEMQKAPISGKVIDTAQLMQDIKASHAKSVARRILQLKFDLSAIRLKVQSGNCPQSAVIRVDAEGIRLQAETHNDNARVNFSCNALASGTSFDSKEVPFICSSHLSTSLSNSQNAAQVKADKFIDCYVSVTNVFASNTAIQGSLMLHPAKISVSAPCLQSISAMAAAFQPVIQQSLRLDEQDSAGPGTGKLEEANLDLSAYKPDANGSKLCSGGIQLTLAMKSLTLEMFFQDCLVAEAILFGSELHVSSSSSGEIDSGSEYRQGGSWSMDFKTQDFVFLDSTDSSSNLTRYSDEDSSLSSFIKRRMVGVCPGTDSLLEIHGQCGDDGLIDADINLKSLRITLSTRFWHFLAIYVEYMHQEVLRAVHRSKVLSFSKQNKVLSPEIQPAASTTGFEALGKISFRMLDCAVVIPRAVGLTVLVAAVSDLSLSISKGRAEEFDWPAMLVASQFSMTFFSTNSAKYTGAITSSALDEGSTVDELIDQFSGDMKIEILQGNAADAQKDLGIRVPQVLVDVKVDPLTLSIGRDHLLLAAAILTENIAAGVVLKDSKTQQILESISGNHSDEMQIVHTKESLNGNQVKREAVPAENFGHASYMLLDGSFTFQKVTLEMKLPSHGGNTGNLSVVCETARAGFTASSDSEIRFTFNMPSSICQYVAQCALGKPVKAQIFAASRSKNAENRPLLYLSALSNSASSAPSSLNVAVSPADIHVPLFVIRDIISAIDDVVQQLQQPGILNGFGCLQSFTFEQLASNSMWFDLTSLIQNDWKVLSAFPAVFVAESEWLQEHKAQQKAANQSDQVPVDMKNTNTGIVEEDIDTLELWFDFSLPADMDISDGSRRLHAMCDCVIRGNGKTLTLSSGKHADIIVSSGCNVKFENIVIRHQVEDPLDCIKLETDATVDLDNATCVFLEQKADKAALAVVSTSSSFSEHETAVSLDLSLDRPQPDFKISDDVIESVLKKHSIEPKGVEICGKSVINRILAAYLQQQVASTQSREREPRSNANGRDLDISVTMTGQHISLVADIDAYSLDVDCNLAVDASLKQSGHQSIHVQLCQCQMSARNINEAVGVVTPLDMNINGCTDSKVSQVDLSIGKGSLSISTTIVDCGMQIMSYVSDQLSPISAKFSEHIKGLLISDDSKQQVSEIFRELDTTATFRIAAQEFKVLFSDFQALTSEPIAQVIMHRSSYELQFDTVRNSTRSSGAIQANATVAMDVRNPWSSAFESCIENLNLETKSTIELEGYSILRLLSSSHVGSTPTFTICPEHIKILSSCSKSMWTAIGALKSLHDNEQPVKDWTPPSSRKLDARVQHATTPTGLLAVSLRNISDLQLSVTYDPTLVKPYLTETSEDLLRSTTGFKKSLPPRQNMGFSLAENMEKYQPAAFVVSCKRGGDTISYNFVPEETGQFLLKGAGISGAASHASNFLVLRVEKFGDCFVCSLSTMVCVRNCSSIAVDLKIMSREGSTELTSLESGEMVSFSQLTHDVAAGQNRESNYPQLSIRPVSTPGQEVDWTNPVSILPWPAERCDFQHTGGDWSMLSLQVWEGEPGMSLFAPSVINLQCTHTIVNHSITPLTVHHKGSADKQILQVGDSMQFFRSVTDVSIALPSGETFQLPVSNLRGQEGGRVCTVGSTTLNLIAEDDPDVATSPQITVYPVAVCLNFTQHSISVCDASGSNSQIVECSGKQAGCQVSMQPLLQSIDDKGRMLMKFKVSESNIFSQAVNAANEIVAESILLQANISDLQLIVSVSEGTGTLKGTRFVCIYPSLSILNGLETFNLQVSSTENASKNSLIIPGLTSSSVSLPNNRGYVSIEGYSKGIWIDFLHSAPFSFRLEGCPAILRYQPSTNSAGTTQIEIRVEADDDLKLMMLNSSCRPVLIRQMGASGSQYSRVDSGAQSQILLPDPTGCILPKPVQFEILDESTQRLGKFKPDVIKRHKKVKINGKTYVPVSSVEQNRMIFKLEEHLSATDSIDENVNLSIISKVIEFDVSINVAGANFSLIDEHHKEFLSIHSQGWIATAKLDRSAGGLGVTASLKSLQIDRFDEYTGCAAVVLYAVDRKSTIFEYSAIIAGFTGNLLQIPFMSLAVRELNACLDPHFLWKLDSFRLAVERSALQLSHLQSITQMLDSSEDPSDSDGNSKKFFLQGNMIYTGLLQLHPIKINISILPRTHTSKGLPVVFRILPSVDDAPIRINALHLKHVLAPQRVVFRRLVRHYVRQGLQQSYKIIGSLNMIGDPLGLVSSMGTGLIDAFYEPSKALVTSPKEFGKVAKNGFKGLVGRSMSGAFGSIAKSTGSVTKGVAMLSLDDDYNSERRKQEKAANIGDGVKKGLSSFGKGLVGGVTGIVSQPLKGAKKEGAKGFLKGLGKGVIGVATKPVAGALDIATKVTEGASSQSKKLHTGGTVKPIRFARIRQSNMNILPLSSQEERANQILQSTKCDLPFSTTVLLRDGFEAFSMLNNKGDLCALTPSNLLVYEQEKLTVVPVSSIISASNQGKSIVVIWNALKSNNLRRLSIGSRNSAETATSTLIVDFTQSSSDCCLFKERIQSRLKQSDQARQFKVRAGHRGRKFTHIQVIDMGKQGGVRLSSTGSAIAPSINTILFDGWRIYSGERWSKSDSSNSEDTYSATMESE